MDSNPELLRLLEKLGTLLPIIYMLIRFSINQFSHILLLNYSYAKNFLERECTTLVSDVPL